MEMGIQHFGHDCGTNQLRLTCFNVIVNANYVIHPHPPPPGLCPNIRCPTRILQFVYLG